MAKKHHREVGPGEWFEVIPGKQVRLFGIKEKISYRGHTRVVSLAPYEKIFKIGDEAEYDSFNLKYTGKITSIGAKTVTIDPGHGDSKRRLRLPEFHRRNWKFDSDAIEARNAEIGMHL
tara:strand:- start:67 stop:423 length:357 start_codon:yes stop_codon:yes gene_type:complete